MHDPEAEAVSPAGLQVDGAAAQCLEAASSNISCLTWLLLGKECPSTPLSTCSNIKEVL